jgi:aspartate carbamoyltransferase catalytic subunit
MTLPKQIRSADDLTRADIEQLFVRAEARAHAPQDETQMDAGNGVSADMQGALVDLYLIRHAKGMLDGLRVALLGNLKFGAEAQLLAQLLGRFDVRLSFVSPAALSMPYDLSDELRAAGLEVEETNDLATTLRKTDVLYLSPIDAARVEKKVYDRTKDFYKLSSALLAEAKPGLFVLGEWEGVGELLAPSRARAQEAQNALMLAWAYQATEDE